MVNREDSIHLHDSQFTSPVSAAETRAIVATLAGNNSGCTAIVRGGNGATGIAVVELYALP